MSISRINDGANASQEAPKNGFIAPSPPTFQNCNVAEGSAQCFDVTCERNLLNCAVEEKQLGAGKRLEILSDL
jgi:hypothetical protein